MEIANFVDVIYGNGAGYATIVTKDAHGNPTVQKFFSYPDEAEEMVAYAKNHAGDDVYFSPIIYYEQRRIRENAKSVAVVYADADTCAPENFRLPPTVSVETSEGRWHCYWVLDNSYEPHRVAMASKQIAYGHKDQGCDLSGWNPTKLLRIPETANGKYSPKQTVKANANGIIYTLDEIEKVYADIIVEQVMEPSNIPLPEKTPQVMEVLAKLPAGTDIMELYMQEPNQGSDMSKMLWKLEMELFRAGLSADEVFVIAKHAKCNKYHSPTRTKRLDADGDLWREVQRASQSFATPQPDIEPIAGATEFSRDVDFLVQSERQFVATKSTFIDKYVDWAAKKTDGAMQYQIASAFTMLSCAFSDTGYGTPKYGKLGLNLWFMLLGETTLSRKSTSRQLMLRMVRSYEKFVGYQIDIGSNVTAEGLVKHLAGRDKMTSMFHRDEVQGMFKEFVTKTYMATAADQFTELYDGHVPVVIRSTGGKSAGSAVQSDRAETNFIMYLMGITSKVSEILTVDYFRSGFLARFLFAVADAPDRTYELEAVEQATDEVASYQDFEMDTLVRSIYDSALYWQKKGAPFPRPVRMTDEALNRFNKFKWDMGTFTEGHPNEDSIEPSRQRLALSVWKCAILLAMYDRSDEVQVDHVLIAIHYAEEWFKNLVRMAASISESEWQREVDNLEAFVTNKGGRVRYEEAYKRFGNKRKREFDEMVDSLKSQARVKISAENNKTFLEVVV